MGYIYLKKIIWNKISISLAQIILSCKYMLHMVIPPFLTEAKSRGLGG